MKAIYVESDGTWVQDWDVEREGMQSLPEEPDVPGDATKTHAVHLLLT